jgi:protein phosphatase
MAVIPNNAPSTNRPATRQNHESLMTYATRLHWTSAALSNVGLVRPINEDSYLDQTARGLWAVADGMGGHARGDLASRMVVEALDKISPSDNLTKLIAFAHDQLLTANNQLRMEAAKQNVRIIGSTVVALIACGDQCGFIWAGDSRLYLCRDGELRQLTRDHSRMEALKSMGSLSPEMLANHPARNAITRAVGAHDELALDEDTLEVHDGDIFLLCSDGLSNEVTEHDMRNALVSGDCRQAAEALMNLALMRGGHDNISIVVVRAEDFGNNEKTVVNPLL